MEKLCIKGHSKWSEKATTEWKETFANNISDKG